MRLGELLIGSERVSRKWSASCAAFEVGDAMLDVKGGVGGGEWVGVDVKRSRGVEDLRSCTCCWGLEEGTTIFNVMRA